MKTIRNIWYYVIHTFRLLKWRIWGHNSARVIVGNEEMSFGEFQERFMPKPAHCQLRECGLPLHNTRGQVAKYHSYCRKFRNNSWGFDPSKVEV
jgi:hypothetical protein